MQCDKKKSNAHIYRESRLTLCGNRPLINRDITLPIILNLKWCILSIKCSHLITHNGVEKCIMCSTHCVHLLIFILTHVVPFLTFKCENYIQSSVCMSVCVSVCMFVCAWP